MAVIDSIYDFSDKALAELVAYLQQWTLPTNTKGGGGSGGYTLIEEIPVPTITETVTFDNIPQSYRHLVVEAILSSSTGTQQPSILWNDLDSGYKDQSIFAWGGTGPIVGNNVGGGDYVSFMQDLLSEGGPNLGLTFKFPYYASDQGKTVLWLGSSLVGDGQFDESAAVGNGMGFNSDTDPITKIVFANPNSDFWEDGSSFSLYGIK